MIDRMKSSTGALLAACAIASPAAAEPAVRVVDRPQEQRVEVMVGIATHTAGGRYAVAVAAGLPNGAVMHGFSAALTGADGGSVAAPWRIELRGSRGAAVLVQLGAAQPELALPRPFGVLLAVGDSLVIAMHELPAVDSLLLRIDIAYENGAAGRLTTEPLQARTVHDASDARSWELRPEVSGRIVVLAGLDIAAAREIVLLDVDADVVLWRLHATERGLDFVSHGTVVRPSVPLQAGRTYRVEVRGGSVAAGDLLALIAVPSRRTD
jgi:hypothetical protein